MQKSVYDGLCVRVKVSAHKHFLQELTNHHPLLEGLKIHFTKGSRGCSCGRKSKDFIPTKQKVALYRKPLLRDFGSL